MAVDEKSCGTNRIKIVLGTIGIVLVIVFFFGTWVIAENSETKSILKTVEIDATMDLDKHIDEFRPKVEILQGHMERQEVIHKVIQKNQDKMLKSLERIERKQ